MIDTIIFGMELGDQVLSAVKEMISIAEQQLSIVASVLTIITIIFKKDNQ